MNIFEKCIERFTFILRFFFLENTKFIEVVEKYPCIYDYTRMQGVPNAPFSSVSFFVSNATTLIESYHRSRRRMT
ncbi:unnamed protein product [Callosobruchus maculatus]|uniref:Uncharacterized protein n=1 Tax=Callosobruchus maculatus TaxID=64391 RepID=A0A653DN82_CALMS|nr:unnamed protein product [Callosobruchus maculatus]